MEIIKINGGRESQDPEIDVLPVEMLEQIFLALDAKSVKNCCLVNKKWNNIIGQSTLVMEKLALKLWTNQIPDPKNETFWSIIYHDTKNFVRKFHTIDIRVDETNMVWDEYAIKTLSKFGAECRRIEIYEYDDLESGLDLWAFIKQSKIPMESVNLFPLLESVEIKSENEKFASQVLKFLSSSQLKHLSYEVFSGCSELMKFLSTQTKITTLDLTFCVTFWDQNLSCDIERDIERIQIPLKTLWLKNCSLSSVEDPKMLVAFVSRFTETLEDFICILKCDLVYEMIFMKLNKLESLTIDRNCAPQENSFYHKLRPNYSLKKLCFDELIECSCFNSPESGHYGHHSSNKEIVKKVIGLSPNVETLELDDWQIPYDTLSFVSKHLKRLTTLQLTYTNSFGRELDYVRLPSVKTIVFGDIEHVGHAEWKLIVDAFPNIESMSVFNFNPSYYEPGSLSHQSIKRIARSLPNLISLKLGAEFIDHHQLFIELLRNCKKIKRIELEKRSFKSEKSKAKILKLVKEHGLQLIIDKRR